MVNLAIVMHAMGKQSASRTHRHAFSIRGMSSSVTTKIKDKRTNISASLLVFAPRNDGYASFMQFIVEECKERMSENQMTTQ